MRIVINTRFLMKNRLEGFGWFTYEIFKRVVQAHPEHEFIFLFDRPFDAEFIFAPNVKGVVLFPPARHPFLFVWWYEWSVRRALRRLKADLFVSPDGYLSLGSRTPTLMVVHDLAFLHFPHHLGFMGRHYLNFFTPRFVRRADRLVVVSEYTRQDVHQQFGTSLDKMDVVYNACDARFKPLPAEAQQQYRLALTGGRPYFLYVGSVHPRKNLPRLLRAYDAFKTATGADAVLVVAGRMAWRTGEVGDTLQSMKHREDVILLDYVPGDTLPKLIASAMALTYVSVFEGFGIPIADALHCETPVICSNVTSMPEVAGDAGLLIDPYSETDIAAALTRIWSEPALRESLVAKGRIRRNAFSWDESARKMWDSMMKTLEAAKP